MGFDSQGYRVQILVAVIGLIGVLGGALIANWDKFRPDGDADPGPPTAWHDLTPFAGDCQSLPPRQVCARFDDGYVWAIRGPITGWDQRSDEEGRIQVAIAGAVRHEHVLGTHRVRVVR